MTDDSYSKLAHLQPLRIDNDVYVKPARRHVVGSELESIPLNVFRDELIDLVVFFEGGSASVCGRVRFIEGSCEPFFAIGETVKLPADAYVRREKVGKAYTFYSNMKG